MSTPILPQSGPVSSAQSQATFEESTASQAAQLLADPLTEATRKRQSLLLLVSVLSLAVFFGILAPEKVSLGGVDARVTAPLNANGQPSTSLATIERNTERFNVFLSFVVLYALCVFWLGAYRDYKAGAYVRILASIGIRKAAAQETAPVYRWSDELISVVEQYEAAVAAKSDKDPEAVALYKRICDLTDTDPGKGGALVKKTADLRRLKATARRVHRAWQILEIALPSLIGLAGIVFPCGVFLFAARR